MNLTDFPSSGDYIQAVQNPQVAFRDPVLRAARFPADPILGIPMPASGSFAVVFRAEVGGVDRALRFFTQDSADRDRYVALGSYATAAGLRPRLAVASWDDGAILVNGRPWPVINMEWVEGRTLDAYVAHLADHGDGGALGTLAGEWRTMIAALQQAQFAHGDLQHGNVLVDTASTLRLVDFDGSWIAPFAGAAPPREDGHPNYQRKGREWGRWMDTFPGLVVYTALTGLARAPRIWERQWTNDKIMFSGADFAPPFATPTWRHLGSIGDPQVDHMLALLKRCCDPAWKARGSLEDLLAPTVVVTARPPPTVDPATGPLNMRWYEQTAGGGPTVPLPPPPMGRQPLPPPPMGRQPLLPPPGRPHTPPVDRPGPPTGQWWSEEPAPVKPPRSVAATVLIALLVGVVVFYLTGATIAGATSDDAAGVILGALAGILTAMGVIVSRLRR